MCRSREPKKSSSVSADNSRPPGRSTPSPAARQTASMPESPEIRYAKSGDRHVGYQILGEGPLDLLALNYRVQYLDRPR